MVTHEIAAPTPCPSCGGERFLAEALPTVMLIPPDSNLNAFNSNWPVAWTLANGGSQMWALVCEQCGKTDLFAKDPAALRR